MSLASLTIRDAPVTQTVQSVANAIAEFCLVFQAHS